MVRFKCVAILTIVISMQAFADGARDNIRIDGDFVFAIAAGKVVRIDRRSGERAELASTKPDGALAVDSEFVYWTEFSGDGTVSRTRRDGTGRPSRLASGLSLPIGIAQDAENLYVAT